MLVGANFDCKRKSPSLPVPTTAIFPMILIAATSDRRSPISDMPDVARFCEKHWQSPSVSASAQISSDRCGDQIPCDERIKSPPTVSLA